MCACECWLVERSCVKRNQKRRRRREKCIRIVIRATKAAGYRVVSAESVPVRRTLRAATESVRAVASHTASLARLIPPHCRHRHWAHWPCRRRRLRATSRRNPRRPTRPPLRHLLVRASRPSTIRAAREAAAEAIIQLRPWRIRAPLIADPTDTDRGA